MNATLEHRGLLAKRGLFALAILVFAGAGTLNAQQTYPPLGPLPPAPAVNQKKVAIGKLLFFDKRMAQDINRGCFECHNPTLGYTTRLDLSDGYPATKYFRNAPTLLNSVYLDDLFWVGNMADIPTAVQFQHTSDNIMQSDARYIDSRMHQIPKYNEMFEAIWPDRMYYYPDIVDVISEYVKSLVSDPNQIPFDRAMMGKGPLSAEAQRGMDLFTGKARCIQCHNGPLLTDEQFYNTAVPHNPTLDNDVERQISMRAEYMKTGTAEYFMNPTRDWGRYTITHLQEDKAKFRTAPLRELKYTAPYMHNGIFQTLEQVVDFYNSGGDARDPLITPTKSPLMRPLGLSPSEKKDLVAFLGSLSSEKQPQAEMPTEVGEEKILYGVFPLQEWHPKNENVKKMPKPTKLTR